MRGSVPQSLLPPSYLPPPPPPSTQPGPHAGAPAAAAPPAVPQYPPYPLYAGTAAPSASSHPAQAPSAAGPHAFLQAQAQWAYYMHSVAMFHQMQQHQSQQQQQHTVPTLYAQPYQQAHQQPPADVGEPATTSDGDHGGDDVDGDGSDAEPGKPSRWARKRAARRRRKMEAGQLHGELSQFVGGEGLPDANDSGPHDGGDPPAAVLSSSIDSQEAMRCDTCDKSFSNERQMNEHMRSHKKCSLCDFVGTSKVIAAHKEEEHLDDEAASMYPKVVLETPEDIEQWIKARKRNYPTDQNIQKKFKTDEKPVQAKKKQAKRDPVAPLFHGAKRRPLLNMMLETDLKKDKNALLQCIRFIVENNFFDDKAPAVTRPRPQQAPQAIGLEPGETASESEEDGSNDDEQQQGDEQRHDDDQQRED
nr:nuclear fragile X mental retardation protein interacting protein 1 [Polyrhizophydium stewartii]